MIRGKEFFRKAADFIAAHKAKVGIWGVGIVGNKMIDWCFNFILYPFVIWQMGVFKGGIVMIFLSFLVCYLTIIFYDWSKKDWLGIETIKGTKEYNGSSKIGRFASWILKKGDVAVMLFLSIHYDPFITTVYMRHGAHKYNGISSRDWKIFISSLVIGNLYWVVVVYAGVYLIKFLFKA